MGGREAGRSTSACVGCGGGIGNKDLSTRNGRPREKEKGNLEDPKTSVSEAAESRDIEFGFVMIEEINSTLGLGKGDR